MASDGGDDPDIGMEDIMMKFKELSLNDDRGETKDNTNPGRASNEGTSKTATYKPSTSSADPTSTNAQATKPAFNRLQRQLTKGFRELQGDINRMEAQLKKLTEIRLMTVSGIPAHDDATESAGFVAEPPKDPLEERMKDIVFDQELLEDIQLTFLNEMYRHPLSAGIAIVYDQLLQIKATPVSNKAKPKSISSDRKGKMKLLAMMKARKRLRRATNKMRAVGHRTVRSLHIGSVKIEIAAIRRKGLIWVTKLNKSVDLELPLDSPIVKDITKEVVKHSAAYSRNYSRISFVERSRERLLLRLGRF
ncbi:hypothetical protein F5Y04DRAFT_283783 [Hypomontagnella monticulosa]|nr:hypothetical protein F5Y04DRAFT_283783 [Hypomontagnella monticulosa]